MRTRLSRVCGLILFATSLASPARAAVALSWNAPAGCASQHDIESRIGARVRGGDYPPVVAHATRDQSGVHVRLRIGERERALEAPTCEAAAEAVAVVVALALDGTDTRPEDPAPPSKPAPPPASPRAPVHLVGSITGGIDASSLPKPAAGAGAGFEVQRGWLGIGLSLAAYLPTSGSAAALPTLRTRVGLAEAMATGCVMVPIFADSLRGGGCLGVGAGWLYGKSEGISEPKSGSGFRPQGSFAARAVWSLAGPLALRLEAGGLLDPVRFPFRVTNVGDVYRPPFLAFRASIGLEARFR